LIMNYRQIYAQKAERERRIKAVAPTINHNSGIYVFYRTDENGFRFAYVGQALHLVERCASHLAEYDHIGLSLKKRGLYSVANPYGWKLTFYECTPGELDEEERKTIKKYGSGIQLYNTTLGGQSDKSNLREGKSTKGYHDGLKQGEENARKFVANLFNKHLDYTPKSGKPNKNQEKAMQKFKEFLEQDTGG
jgi:hypothetical protein